MYVHTSQVHRELPFYEHIAPRMTQGNHQGRENIRKLLRTFNLSGPHGTHVVLVVQPAQMSLRDMKAVFFKDGFDESLVKGAIAELLLALDFLHGQGETVHTGSSFDPTYPKHLLHACKLTGPKTFTLAT